MSIMEALQSMGGQPMERTPDPNGYQDPVAKMNALEKLGLGLGGIDAVNDYRRSFAGSEKPAALREWQEFNAMSPEDQRRYLQMKRSNQMFDRGGSQVVLDPTGGMVTEIDKTIAPEQQTDFKVDQTRQIEETKQDVARQGTTDKKISDAGDVVDLATQAEDYLADASGSYLDTAASFGKRVIGSSDAETQANAALKVISGKLVSNMPRMEGPQSDKDVQLYKDMAANIADPTVPAQDKRVALQALKDLNAKYADKQGGGQTQNAPNGGGRRTISFGDLK